MIRVTPPPVPAGMARRVVAPAKRWASEHGIDWNAPPPKPADLPACWTKILPELHQGHGGTCAYLSIYLELAVQAASVDHFIPKSLAPVSKAYDWRNFRLASRAMNTHKRDFTDVLDPFTLVPELFSLNLLSGRIGVNRTVAPARSPLHKAAHDTLKRLKLNASLFRELRLKHLDRYLSIRASGTAEALVLARQELAVAAPFVHAEVLRQGW
ncbi:hypothetical protein ACU6VI_07045 [Sphaerotilus natans]|uniref:hypothetical protein n=1 Tax=Sphaerotilus natans TaxID=34103 RepID=UPI00406C80BA